MAGLVGLATGVGSTLSEARSVATIIVLSDDDRSNVVDSAQAFQYFPETISDNKAVNWQPKEIPGGSLPVYQWVASGERTVSFTAQFSSDIDLVALTQSNIQRNLALGGLFAESASEAISAGVAGVKDRLKNSGQGERNIDIRSAVAWLRQYMLPTYGQHTKPPPKLKLYLPKSGIGLAGGDSLPTSQDADSIICVMTTCDVTWEKFFPSGNPRLASVSLAFAQIPQFQGVVTFPQRTPQMLAATTDGATVGATSFFGYKSFFRKPPPQR